MNLFKSILSRVLRDVILDDVVEKTVPKVCVELKADIQKRVELSLKELCKYEDLKEKTDEEFYNLYKYKKISELSPAELRLFIKRFDVVVIKSTFGIYKGRSLPAREGEFVGEVLDKIFERRNSKVNECVKEVQNVENN